MWESSGITCPNYLFAFLVTREDIFIHSNYEGQKPMFLYLWRYLEESFWGKYPLEGCREVVKLEGSWKRSKTDSEINTNMQNLSETKQTGPFSKFKLLITMNILVSFKICQSFWVAETILFRFLLKSMSKRFFYKVKLFTVLERVYSYRHLVTNHRNDSNFFKIL